MAVCAAFGLYMGCKMFNLQGAVPAVAGVVGFFLTMGLKD